MHTRAISIVALIQVGVIVFGNLFVGIDHKMMTEMLGGKPLPLFTELTYQYGSLGLLLPINWVFLALFLRNESEFSKSTRNQAALSLGIGLILALLFYFTVVCIAPFATVTWHLAG